MNPLVQDMLLAQREDLELRNLEGLLEDDCKCESSHTESSCSYDVSYLIVASCSGKAWQVCYNSAENTRKSAKVCGLCLSLDVRDCWAIRPI